MSLDKANIEILEDADAVARAAAALLLVSAERAIRDRGVFRVALSGGRTPRRLFELLARSPVGAAVDWGRTHLFQADERHVDANSPDSNYRLIADTLLPHVPMAEDHIHRIRTECGDPQTVARDYEDRLRAHFGVDHPPAFDLILLGMGADGHTASIFPGDEQSPDCPQWVRAVGPVSGWARITLTGPVLRAGRSIGVIVTGTGKADVLADVLWSTGDERRYPIHLLWPVLAKVVWLVDRDAAGRLDA